MPRFLCALAAAIALTLPAAAIAQPNPAANDPNTCKTIWQAIGLPKQTGGDKTIVCHPRFVLQNDNTSKTPDWVIDVLDKDKLGKLPRPKRDFKNDDNVPKRGQPTPGDYDNTADKFEVGHMAPSEDFANNDADMRATFVFSNAVPQVGDDFNAAIWKTLEGEFRKAAAARGKLFVITGPLRGDGNTRTIAIAKADNACKGAIELDAIKTKIVCDAVNKHTAATCTTGTIVPVALYKIAYDPAAKAVYAFVLPNRNHPIHLGKKTHMYLDQWRVNVGVIQKLTGLQFFDALPAAQRDSLINKCETTVFWAPPKKK